MKRHRFSTIIEQVPILFVTLLWLFGFLCSATVWGQSHADLEHEILAYIQPSALEFPSGESGAVTISQLVIPSQELSQALTRFTIQSLAKALPAFSEMDSVRVMDDGRLVSVPRFSRIFRIQLLDRTQIDSAILVLSRVPGVLFAEKNMDARLFSDPTYGNQWHLSNTGQSGGTAGADIRAEEAWAIYTGSPNVKIAIIDSGVETDHEDLSGKASGDPTSSKYHGTHVAGIAAAKANNDHGGRGVDWNAQILSRKIFDPSYVGDAAAADKIVNAVDNGAHVLNNSWGGSDYSTTVRLAFSYAYMMNQVSVVAMGNNNGSQTQYPAGFGQGIIAVGSTQDNDVVSSFSNTGNHIDVSAPGGYDTSTTNSKNIWSTWGGNSYLYLSGTSMATPVVSGIASLLKGFNANLYNDDIEHIIQLSADDKGPTGWDSDYGYGRVNAKKALNRLQIPYEINQLAASGGTDQGASSQYQMVIWNAPGLSPGVYFVKRHEVRKDVTFSSRDNINVWGRGVATTGWANNGGVNYSMGWCEPVPGTITSTSATLRTYVYEVRTINLNWIGWFPSEPTGVQFAYTVHGTRAIASPTSLSGSPQSGSSIRLTWQDNSDNEMGFKIERGTDGVNFSQIGEMITNGNGTGIRTYDDEGLSQNVVYYYRVRAFAQEFSSGHTNTVSAMIPTLSAPTNLTTTTDFPYRVQLSWDVVSSAGAYRVYRSASESGSFTQVADVSGTSYLDQVPNAPQAWYYYVRPRVGEYEGPQSATQSAAAYHLASSSPEAMAFNNQRKITRDNLGYWHKVYQSAGLIWYTRSLDFSGTSWAPEKLLSPIFEGYPEEGRYRDPSIIYVPEVATGGGGVFGDGEMPDAQEHRIRIAYEIYATDESEHGIYVCELDLNGNTTYGPEQLGSLWQGQGERARPVLGVAREGSEKYTTAFNTLVTWYESGSEQLKCRVWWPGNTVSCMTDLGYGIIEFAVSPYGNTNNAWHLAYIENNNVMYMPITPHFCPQAGTPQTVFEGDESVYLNAPSISSVNANDIDNPIGVTWQAYYWEFVTGVIQYSERNTQTWSYPATWVPYYTTASYVKPSVTGSIGTPKATIAWQTTEAPLMYTVRGRPGAWGSVTSRGSGADPTLSAGYLANSFEYLVSRGTTAPYAIQRQGISTTDENEEGDSMPFTTEGRGGRLMFRNGSLHIAVLDAQANDIRLGFAEMNDTTRINLSQFENVFVTEPFAGTGTLKLTTLFTAKGQLPNGINIRMTLRDAATGNVVQNLRTFHVGDDTLVTFQTTLNHGNRQLKLVLQPIGVAQLSRIDLERWYVVDEAASLAKRLAHVTKPNGLPEVFAVHPNYPNPFNPTTTIKYDLPEASHVSLVVYDLLGRKVTELVSGQKAEGYHSAMWDASSLASGVYFARFTATDMNGGVRLNKVSKLVLTK